MQASPLVRVKYYASESSHASAVKRVLEKDNESTHYIEVSTRNNTRVIALTERVLTR